jgi:hypothetical protein
MTKAPGWMVALLFGFSRIIPCVIGRRFEAGKFHSIYPDQMENYY